jgi:signal transduction histidine kinase/sensor domain CHASE-containing protein/ActR/RegA family two-component response regulator
LNLRSDLFKIISAQRLLPFFVGTGVIVFTIILCLALSNREQTQAEQKILLTSSGLTSNIRSRINARVELLARLKKHWSSRENLSESEQRSDAEFMLNYILGCEAIGYVDTSSKTRWLAQTTERSLPYTDLGWAESLLIELGAPADDDQALITRAIEAPGGEKIFLVSIPTFPGNGPDGMIVGIFSVQETVDTILNQTVAPGYSISIFDGQEQIYSRNFAAEQKGRGWKVDSVIPLQNVKWQMEIRPSQALLDEGRSYLPEVIMAGGTLMALLLAVAVLLAQTARARTAAVLAGNQEMKREIAERKRTEDALRKSEERYRAFVQQSSEGIWCYEAEQPIPITLTADEQVEFFHRYGYLAECNDAMAHMYEASSAEELIGARVNDLLPLDEDNRQYLMAFINSGYRMVDAETHEVDKHGHQRYFLNNLVGVVENGFLLRAWGSQREITERKLLEQQLLQSQRMEAVGRLAGGIAHDFNNLLTAIIGYSDLMLMDSNGNQAARSSAEEIKKAGQRAAGLTRQLLAFSRKQVLQPKVIELNAVVEDMDKMLRRLIGEDLELITVLEESRGRVKADPGQIEQVIMNLAVNARDAMPRGGKLTIETADIELDDLYIRQHMEVEPGPYVLLAVSDTGHGMDKETQSHIFEPFFTTKEPGQGTGLGLATVYGIIRQSGGNIWVYSEPGQGTTFKVYLPRVEDEADICEAQACRKELCQGSETILLVEDEVSVRRLASEILQMNGYRVFEAGRGSEAIEICEREHGPINMMVTDVVMPRMSGPQLADHLAEVRPDMKVLYMSGYTDGSIINHGVLASGTAFLQKPFTPASLLNKVREILNPEQPQQ